MISLKASHWPPTFEVASVDGRVPDVPRSRLDTFRIGGVTDLPRSRLDTFPIGGVPDERRSRLDSFQIQTRSGMDAFRI